MDPALQERLEGPAEDVIEVLLRLADAAEAPVSVTTIARFGNVVTARVPRGKIRQIWTDPAVISMKASRLLQLAGSVLPEWHSRRTGTGHARKPEREPLHPRSAETGKGVVIGVIDWGFDVMAPSFRKRDGASRILALWDQRDRADRAPPLPYGYGVVHSRGDINAALRQPDPEAVLGYSPAVADAGDGAHGTHVAHIAAGTGTSNLTSGMAPDADLVFVHLAAGDLSGLATLGDSVRMAEAIDFIRQTAGERHFVINMSVGRHGGPHTGTSLLEQAIDALVTEAPGRAVVMSTGNYHQSQTHAAGRLVPGRRTDISWLTRGSDLTGNEIEIWYRNVDRFRLKLHAPDGTAMAEAELGENQPLIWKGREIGRLYHRAFDSASPDHQINLFLKREAPAGLWHLRLTGEKIADGRWDAYIERDALCRDCQSVFTGPMISQTGTLGSICNGLFSITVGAADVTASRPQIAPFSSSGPTRDGRQKPDLVAPGVRIVSARSRSAQAPQGGSCRKSGASQAAPYVAGTIALMFEAAGRKLTIHETRSLLLGSSRLLSGESKDLLRIGAGLVDPSRALAATRDYIRSGALRSNVPTALSLGMEEMSHDPA